MMIGRILPLINLLCGLMNGTLGRLKIDGLKGKCKKKIKSKGKKKRKLILKLLKT
jgi:hypothetical protein